MPSHPDRVRRNYHTVTDAAVNLHREQIVNISVAVTRQEIASWMYPPDVARAVAERIYRQVLELFNPPKPRTIRGERLYGGTRWRDDE